VEDTLFDDLAVLDDADAQDALCRGCNSHD
jgi:hypothetical protein